MEDKFRPLQKMQIPDSNDTIGLIESGRVLVVRCDAKLRILGEVRSFKY